MDSRQLDNVFYFASETQRQFLMGGLNGSMSPVENSVVDNWHPQRVRVIRQPARVQNPPNRVKRHRPMIQRSGYKDHNNLGYSPYGNREIPTISNTHVHETRPTGNYASLQPQNTRLVTYADVWQPTPISNHQPTYRPRPPSQELRGGVMYECTCDRRDGLQDDCQWNEFPSRPMCVVHPSRRYESRGRGDLYYG